jgi:hypothetical protein
MMGDFSWLASLGPDKLLALAIGLMFLGWLVPRWVLNREREISEQWRLVAETTAANTADQMKILHQLVDAVEKLADQLDDTVGRHRFGHLDGYDGYRGYNGDDGIKTQVRPMQQLHLPPSSPNGEM